MARADRPTVAVPRARTEAPEAELESAFAVPLVLAVEVPVRLAVPVAEPMAIEVRAPLSAAADAQDPVLVADESNRIFAHWYKLLSPANIVSINLANITKRNLESDQRSKRSRLWHLRHP